MQYQSRNDVPRKGEPEDHELAVIQLRNWFFDNRKEDTLPFKDFKIRFHTDFIMMHHLDYSFHSYDLVVTRYPVKPEDILQRKNILYVFEVRGVIDDNVKLSDGRTLSISKTRHLSKRQQIINDQISEDYIREYYPDAEYFTPDKSDCFNYHYVEKLCSQLKR